MDNEQIIKDATSSADLQAGGGYMSPKQAATFLRMVFNETPLLRAARTINMVSPVHKYPKIGVGSRIMRGIVEGEDVSAYTNKPEFGEFELKTAEYALPWEILLTALEDNIEGKSLAQTIAELFAEQMAEDTEDLMINGDTVYTGATPPTVDLAVAINDTDDPVDVVVDDVTGFPRSCEAGWIKINNEYLSYSAGAVDTATNTFKQCARAQNGTTIAAHVIDDDVVWIRHWLIGKDDGWLKRMYSGESNYIDVAGAVTKDTFFEIYNAMPQKYRKQNGKLRWLISDTLMHAFQLYMTERETAAGDAIIGGKMMDPKGIPPIISHKFPEDTIVLTDPRNLIVGIWRRILSRMTDKAKESIMRNVIFYNTTTRIGNQIEREDAIVYADGITAS
jgi:hypothetical protein